MEYDKPSERQEEIYSKAVRAGKRTYFFDIKSTRSSDFYLTITESKKTSESGRDNYQKHKLFLYKEDFDKFILGLQETIEHARELKLQLEQSEHARAVSGVSFEEL